MYKFARNQRPCGARIMPCLGTSPRGPLALVAAVLVVGFCNFAPTLALGQSSVRILVNDQPITSQDIKSRTQMLRVFSRGQQGEKEAIEQLIDERLQLQEAKR